jgi:catechol 2,3-dioxygenase-like lactoylglutathione lyase family enzyme
MLNNKPLMPILPVVDLDRARQFYEKKLGLRPAAENASMVADTGVIYEAGGGTKLELDKRDVPTKAEHTAVTFEVEDIEREVGDLEGRGVRFEDYDLPGLQTAHHIARMDGMMAAWFKDPDGNIICLHQRSPRP